MDEILWIWDATLSDSTAARPATHMHHQFLIYKIHKHTGYLTKANGWTISVNIWKDLRVEAKIQNSRGMT